jgi:two-component system OmpR family sensor kinase
MRLRRLSLLARITAGSLLIAALISVVAVILLYNQVERIVFQGEVAVLSNIEAPYRIAVKAESGEPLDRPAPGQLVAVIAPDATPRIDTLPGALSARLPALSQGADRTEQESVGGRSYLVRVRGVATKSGEWHIVSARDTRVQSALLGQVSALLIGSIVVLNLGFGGASWLIGAAALRPVSRLRRSAQNLVLRPGHELLPSGPVDDEITRLARTLNELITSLRASAARERQIVADASHELRTPLAILHAQFELALAETTSMESARRDLAAAQATLVRLTSIATSLLELSRLDAQSGGGRATVEQLAAELADAADRGRLQASDHDVELDFDAELTDGSAQVAVSDEDFGRVIDNLVRNSLAAVGEGGRIDLLLRQHTRGVTVSVADDGGGMDPAYVRHATERFSRADTSRRTPGAGLGLSIVAAVVAHAGGTLLFDNRPGQGLTVRLELPTAS